VVLEYIRRVFRKILHGEFDTEIIRHISPGGRRVYFGFRFGLRLWFGLRLVGGIYGFEGLDVVLAETAPTQRVGFLDHDGLGVVFRRSFDVGAVASVARRFGRMAESDSMSESMENHIHGLFVR